MQELYNKFDAFLIRLGLEERTKDQHLIRLKVLHREVGNITFDGVESFLTDKIRTGASGSSVNKYVQTIKKWCDYQGLDWGEKVRKVKEINKTKILLSDEEIEQFIATTPPPDRTGLFWSCVAYTGSRPNEVLQLTVNDIDAANKLFIFQNTKTKVGRRVPIAQPLFDQIGEYLKIHPGPYLFYRQANLNSKPDYNHSMSYASLEKDFKKRKKILGITKHITPYSLRHSFITRLLTDAEAPLFVVQDIVGHRNAETTRRYYHGSIKAMHAAILKDPLMRGQMNPQVLLTQLIKYVRDFLQRDKRFGFEINEKEGEVSIKIKIKKKQ